MWEGRIAQGAVIKTQEMPRFLGCSNVARMIIREVSVIKNQDSARYSLRQQASGISFISTINGVSLAKFIIFL